MELGLLTRKKADEQWVSEYVVIQCSPWEVKSSDDTSSSLDLAMQWAKIQRTFQPQASVKSEQDFMEVHALPRVAQWPLAIKGFYL